MAVVLVGGCVDRGVWGSSLALDVAVADPGGDGDKGDGGDKGGAEDREESDGLYGYQRRSDSS